MAAGFVVGALAATGGLAADEAPSDPGADASLVEARRLAGDLTKTIRELLMKELKEGRFEGALRACSETAQQVTVAWRERTGAKGKRVSLRLRNPENAPDAYERAVLEELDRLNAEGHLPEEHYQVVEGAEGPVLRYLKPMVANQLCLKCHGPVEKLAPEIRSLLAERYPEDRATGHAVGDVRGAVSVVVGVPR
jgi:hypothetical protein